MLFEKSTSYIYLFNEINFENVKTAIQEINKANLDDKTDKILITISSGGGLLNPAFALCEYIQLSKKPVSCLATGYCASAAVTILQCGQRRLATSNTRFMLHSSNHRFERGSYEEFVQYQLQVDFLHQQFIDLTINRSGLSEQEFTKLLPMKYLSAQEALKIGAQGLIDQILLKEEIQS